VNWWIHRVATSKHYHVSPHEIRSCWTWAELCETHAMLDAFDEAERATAPK
jgi:hypothetical protein